MKSVIMAMVCVALTGPAAATNMPLAANEDPSLKATLEWLRSAIEMHANNGTAAGAACDSNRQYRPCRFKYVPIDFTGCSITYEFDGQITMGTEARSRKATVVVPLWELATPQARREQDDVRTWLVPLTLRENARIPIRVDEDADPSYLPGHRTYEDRFVWLEFGDINTDNQAMAQRVARAFGHAIELCEGKKPTSGEPF
jgi:hypothetical protein